MDLSTQEKKEIILTKEAVESVVGKRKQCILEPKEPCTLCGACLMCDLDENKICNNCGKCLDEYNTDEKGFVKVKIDKIIKEDSDISLEDLYKQYGLNDDDEE